MVCQFEGNFQSIITLLAAPRKSEGVDSATGLNAKDEDVKLSKKLSLFLSGPSLINMELLPLPLWGNENFPVVGEG